MHKVALAVIGTATGTILLIGVKAAQNSQLVPTDIGAGRIASEGNGATPAPSATLPAGTYTVTGPAEDTPFGPVQVEIKVDNAKVVDVIAVQTPSEHGRSVEINRFATPILRKEALVAQSARIQVVSGATYTSDGYATSLQAALTDAAAGKHD